jgi:hypothetical protein
MVQLHPDLGRITRANPHLSEAIGRNAHTLRMAIQELRGAVDEYRLGYCRWSASNMHRHLERIRQARALHSKSISKILDRRTTP